MHNNFYQYLGRTLAKGSDQWGFHIIIDCDGCDKSTVNSADTIKSFLYRMVKTLGLIPVGEAVVYTFNDGNGRGVSGLQLITTSHISCHTDDDKMSAYIDFFSCGKYSEDIVKQSVDVVDEFFNPKDKTVKILLRDPSKISDA